MAGFHFTLKWEALRKGTSLTRWSEMVRGQKHNIWPFSELHPGNIFLGPIVALILSSPETSFPSLFD